MTAKAPGRERRAEYATPAPFPPTALRDACVHTRRPAQRASMSAEDGAILEILRERARSSDLSPEQTVQRLQRLLAEPGRFAEAAMTERRARGSTGTSAYRLDAGTAPRHAFPGLSSEQRAPMLAARRVAIRSVQLLRR